MNKEKYSSVDAETLWKWLNEAKKKKDSVAIQAISYVLCRMEGCIK